jgi:hypothetical protein
MADTPRSTREWQALADEIALKAPSIMEDAIDGGIQSFRDWVSDDAVDTLVTVLGVDPNTPGQQVPTQMVAAGMCTHTEVGMRLAFWLVKTGRVSL